MHPFLQLKFRRSNESLNVLDRLLQILRRHMRSLQRLGSRRAGRHGDRLQQPLGREANWYDVEIALAIRWRFMREKVRAAGLSITLPTAEDAVKMAIKDFQDKQQAPADAAAAQ